MLCGNLIHPFSDRLIDEFHNVFLSVGWWIFLPPKTKSPGGKTSGTNIHSRYHPASHTAKRTAYALDTDNGANRAVLLTHAGFLRQVRRECLRRDEFSPIALQSLSPKRLLSVASFTVTYSRITSK
jgi:hypothetical protein